MSRDSEGRLQLEARVPARRAEDVSILSRPEGRLQRIIISGAICVQPVSILSRPEGRLQPHAITLLELVWKFQSSAAPKDGCNTASITPVRNTYR